MVTREEADIALAAFAKKVGIPRLEFDHSGTALVGFGDQYELIIFYDATLAQIQLWSPLQDFMLTGVREDDETLMRVLLEKNFPSYVMGGAYFAIDHELGVALIGRSTLIDSRDHDAFTNTIIAFSRHVVEIGEKLTQEIGNASSAGVVSKTEDQDSAIIKA